MLWEGCGPVSAAMVLGYWDNNGYSNFPNDYEGQLQQELADAMGTYDGSGSTPMQNVAPGINDVCNDHGYGDWAYSVLTCPWYLVTNSIDSGNPLVHYMWDAGSPYFEDEEYGNHIIEVHGYCHEPGCPGKYLIIYDTWDTTTHWLNWGNWYYSQTTFVEP